MSNNIKLVFISSDKSEINNEMQCFCNGRREIFIQINDCDDVHNSHFLCLDRQTAIKFVNHLKKEISLIKLD